MEREKIIEIFVGLILILLVFIMVLVGIGFEKPKTTTQVISNSYNTIDNSKKYYEEIQPVNAKMLEKQTQEKYYYFKKSLQNYEKHPYFGRKPAENIYYYKDYEPLKSYALDWEVWNEKSNSKDYDSFGKHTKEKNWEFYADTYKVYVYNEGQGDYFTVTFYFEDYWGNEKIYEDRKYIRHNDERMFYFRDINSESDKYYEWMYIVSH